MDPADLERLVDRALERLPSPPAPRTLLPRVMAAVDGLARRPWYARPWLAWPRPWQVASAALFVVALVATATLVPEAAAAVDRGWGTLGFQVPAGIADAVRNLTTFVEVGRVLGQTMADLVAVYLGPVVLTMFAASVVGVAALNRMVLEGTWES